MNLTYHTKKMAKTSKSEKSENKNESNFKI